MKNSRKCAYLLLILFYMTGLHAQSFTISNITNAEKRGSGALVQDRIVKGYYAFNELDGKDKSNKSYQLILLDAKLAVTGEHKFTAQESLTVVQAAFNGELVMLQFYDAKTDKYLLKAYDLTAKQISSKTIDTKKLYKDFHSALSYDGGEAGQTLTPIDNQGFIHVLAKLRGGATSNSYNEITFIPNNKEAKGWTWTTPEKSADFEWGEVLGLKNNTLYYLVHKRKKLASQGINYSVLGIDMKTGTQLFENPIETGSGSISPISVVMDKEGNFKLLGYLYGEEGKISSAMNLGLFASSIDVSGKVISTKEAYWSKGIRDMLKKNKIYYQQFYAQNFIYTSDNKVFVVAEEYETSKIERDKWIAIKDLFLFEFTSDLAIKDIKVFGKSESSFKSNYLHEGSRSAETLIYMEDVLAYTLTQQSQDKSKFSIFYKTKEKRVGYLASLNYSGGQVKVGKIELNKSATWQTFHAAKPEHIMSVQYNKKERKLEFALEKINF